MKFEKQWYAKFQGKVMFVISFWDERRCSATKNIINEHIPFRCRCYRSLILQMQVLSLGLHPRFNETVSFMFSPTYSLLCLCLLLVGEGTIET